VGNDRSKIKTAQSVLDALGAAPFTFQDGKKALKANLDLGNGAEEVEWEAELLEMPDGGVIDAYPIVRRRGSGRAFARESKTAC
jgi:hypothetical protein